MTSGQMVIDGRFELQARLGSGGMGTVWRALDLVLQREVALKEVRPGGGEAPPDDPALSAMYRERVLREARALARIDHPHVVTIHHIIDSPDMPYPWLVMELVRGESLQDRLARGPMPPAEAATVGRGILAALQAAHQAGICHRDIKPANVLLRADGSPVLTDFGIAVLDEASRVTATGGLVGSPEYIAPERLHGQEGDPASDLWSLGMLLYVAVEGHNPVRRTTLAATLAAVMTAEIPQPRQAGPLTEVIGALLVPQPAARPTAAQLDQMLARAETQPTLPSVATPLPAPPPGPPPGTFPGPAPLPGAFPGPPPVPGAFAASPMPGSFPSTLPAGALPPRRSAAPRILAVTALGVAAIALIWGAVSVLPGLRGTNGDGGGSDKKDIALPQSQSRSAGPLGAPSPSPSSEKTQPASLLTPEGIRTAIDAFEKATGTDRFMGFSVYETYAFAEVPVPGRSRASTRYTYRGGSVSKMGTSPSVAEKSVSLRSFDWAAVPRLWKVADKLLNVPAPTMRYITIDPAWTFAGDQPVMLFYLTDDAGSGYLAASAKGRVLRHYAAD